MDKEYLTIENNETIAYIEKNREASETLVLLHGNMSSGVHYEPLFEHLDDVHLIVPDLRGFGDSTYATPVDGLKDFADDVAMFLRKKGISKAHVAGWSTGGGVALALAARHKDLVERLVLIESCSYRGYPIFKKDKSMQPTDELYTDKASLAEDPVQVAPLIKALRTNDKVFMRQVWDAMIYTVDTPDEAYYEKTLEETLKQRNIVDVDWALLTFNMSHTSNGVSEGDGTIDDVDVPVLMVYGEQDAVIPRKMFEETADALADVETVVYENSGHSPIVDVPKQLSERIKEFLRK